MGTLFMGLVACAVVVILIGALLGRVTIERAVLLLAVVAIVGVLLWYILPAVAR